MISLHPTTYMWWRFSIANNQMVDSHHKQERGFRV